MAGKAAAGVPQEPGKGGQGDNDASQACCISFRIEQRLIRDVEYLENMAQEELANLFSCLKQAIVSSRKDLMMAASVEFHASVSKKVELATQIANSVVQALHERKCSDRTVQESPEQGNAPSKN